MNRHLTLTVLSSLLSLGLGACERSASNDYEANEVHIAAIHQAGHAVFALTHPQTFRVEQMNVTLDAHQVSGGTVVQSVDRDEEGILRMKLSARMAGAVAEEVVLGNVSQGSDKDDIAEAVLVDRIAAQTGDSPYAIMKDSKAIAMLAIESRTTAIKSLGDTLAASGSLNHERIVALFNQN